jgi:hypothetical protein
MARVSRSVWERRIQEWRESGLSAGEFAARIGVNVNTLRNWHYKLQPATGAVAVQSGDEPQVQFVEVAAPPATIAYEPIDVVLTSGARLRVPSRFDEEALRRLVALLDRR